jgi:hypothetical protein
MANTLKKVITRPYDRPLPVSGPLFCDGMCQPVRSRHSDEARREQRMQAANPATLHSRLS